MAGEEAFANQLVEIMVFTSSQLSLGRYFYSFTWFGFVVGFFVCCFVFFSFLNLQAECCFHFCFALKLFHRQIKDGLFSAVILCSSAPVTF